MYFIERVKSGKAFIIAEIGQNHQGSLETALEYVEKFSSLGADAVKFQVRNNKYLFDKKSYSKEYNSENSFGRTYGEHREFLEFSKSSLLKIREKCINLKVNFMATPFDEPSLDTILDLDVDIIKVASFDLGNIPLLKKMAASGKPIVMSCGGGQMEHITASINAILEKNKNLSLLHCVSEYPCPPEKLGLEKIQALIDEYPQVVVGLSDHFNGILSGPLAYMLGARVFEKHVTLNRAWKGTDHSFALEPRGFEAFVRDIARVPVMLKEKNKIDIGNEMVFNKLGKSIIASQRIPKDTLLTENHVRGQILHQAGLPVREMKNILGRRVNRELLQGEKIETEDLC